MKKITCAIILVLAIFCNYNVKASDNTNDVEEIIKIFGVDRSEVREMSEEQRQIILYTVHNLTQSHKILLDDPLLCSGNKRVSLRIWYTDEKGNVSTLHYSNLYSYDPQLVARMNRILRAKEDSRSYTDGQFNVLEHIELVPRSEDAVSTFNETVVTNEALGVGVYYNEKTMTVRGQDHSSYCRNNI